MKEKLINGYEVGKLLANLHKISRDINESFDSYKVASEYLDRFGSLDGELADFVFNPIYFPPKIMIIVLAEKLRFFLIEFRIILLL